MNSQSVIDRSVRRVLVIENHDLLSTGLLRLLAGQAGVLAVAARHENQAHLIQAIEDFKPNVLLFDAAAHCAVIAALLYAGVYDSVLLAVQMDSERTTALRYERRIVELTSLADLLDLILTA